MIEFHTKYYNRMYNLPKTARFFLKLAFWIGLISTGQIFSQEYNSSSDNLFTQCWLYPATDILNLAGASDNDTALYLSLTGGKVISIDSQSIEKLWETDLGSEIVSKPINDSKNIYAAVEQEKLTGQNSEGTIILHSLDKLTGVTRWRTKLKNSGEQRDNLIYLKNAAQCLVAVYNKGETYCLDKNNGSIIWKKNISSEITSLALLNDTEIFFGSVNGQITALSMAEGKTLNSIKIPSVPVAMSEDLCAGRIIIGDKKGFLWSIDKNGKNLHKIYRFGGEITQIACFNEKILSSSLDNFLYSISEKDNKLLWKRRLSGRISAKPLFKDDKILVTSIDDSSMLLINAEDGKLVNKIVLSGENFFNGGSMHIQNLFVYMTRKGLAGFSADNAGCTIRKSIYRDKF